MSVGGLDLPADISHGTIESFRVHEHMDGIRGLLMGLVLALHIFYAAVTIGGRPTTTWYYWPALWFSPAIYVLGFFVPISGYCLMLPVLRGGGELRGGIGHYMKRRCQRIVPPYYTALAISLAHMLLFPQQYSVYGISTGVLHPGVIWSHLLLVYNFKQEWTYEINAPYWSLAPEWQLYILFPVVLLPIWRRVGIWGLLVAGIVATVGLLSGGDVVTRMHPWFLLLFICGMAASVIAGSALPSLARIRDHTPWGRISLVLFAGFCVKWLLLAACKPITFSHLPPSWQDYCLNEILLGLAILTLILYMGRKQLIRPQDWPASLRFLRHRWLTWLGSFSYSHYLVHFPIVIALAAAIRALNLGLPRALALGYVLTVPISLSAGYLFFLAIERRCIPGLKR